MLEEPPPPNAFGRFTAPNQRVPSYNSVATNATTMDRPTQISDIPVMRSTERLKELLSDKSILHMELLSPVKWVKNANRSNCFYCHRKFTPFLRKHHCRGCGDITCRNCTRSRLVQEQGAVKIAKTKLCFDCIDKALVWKHNVEQDANTASSCWNTQQGQHENHHQLLLTTQEALAMNGNGNVTSPMTASQEKKLLQALFRRQHKPYELIRRPSETSGNKSRYASAQGGQPTSETATQSSSLSTEYEDDLDNLQRVFDQSIISSTATATTPSCLSSHSFLDNEEEDEEDLLTQKRLAILTRYNVLLETSSQHQLESLCQVATQGFECEIAAISFFDATRQVFRASRGLSLSEIPLEMSMCFTLVNTKNYEPLIINDTLQNAKFASHPLVTARHKHDPSLPGEASIRFYAVAPVVDASENVMIGSVFVMDSIPHHRLPSKAMEILKSLSQSVEKLVLRAQGRARKTSTSSTSSTSSASPVNTNAIDEEHETPAAASIPVVKARSSSLGYGTDRGADRMLPLPPPPRIYSCSVDILEEQEEDDEQQQDDDQEQDEAFLREQEAKRAKVERKLYRLKKTGRKPVHMRRYSESNLSYLDLLCQISDTQQQIAVQQQVLMTALHDHSSRLGSIENCIERMKEKVFSSCPNSPVTGIHPVPMAQTHTSSDTSNNSSNGSSSSSSSSSSSHGSGSGSGRDSEEFEEVQI